MALGLGDLGLTRLPVSEEVAFSALRSVKKCGRNRIRENETDDICAPPLNAE
jgi:hypothetical protein